MQVRISRILVSALDAIADSAALYSAAARRGLCAVALAVCIAQGSSAAPALADSDVVTQSDASNSEQYATQAVRSAQARGDAIDIDGDGRTDIVVPYARCNESVFKPTICWQDSPNDIKYRPSFAQCSGKAAILLGGKFANSYSVVLRDRANRDRFPPCVHDSSKNFGSCSFFQCDTLGLNRCSAFKCQSTFTRRSGRRKEKVCCLGAAGTDRVLTGATRLTIKVRDVPGSNLDPLIRVALKKNDPKLALN